MNYLTAILCALCVLCGSSGAAEAAQKSNIIVILADDKYKHEPEIIEETSNIACLLAVLN